MLQTAGKGKNEMKRIGKNTICGIGIFLSVFAAGLTAAQTPASKPSDLLISGIVSSDPNAPPPVITNKAELDLALEQTKDILNIPPERLSGVMASYSSILAGLPTPEGISTEDLYSKPPMTIDELGIFLSKRMVDSVPVFPGTPEEDLTADEEIDPITQNRRDAEGVPNTSLIVRRYASHIIEKYDTNQDGILQKEEWEKMPGTPQAIDMNGDLELEEHEILYYLARYAKDRTISHPIPPKRLTAAQTVLKTDGAVLIQPLSAPIRKQRSNEDDEAISSDAKPADMSEDEFQEIVTDADWGTGTEEQPELFGVVSKETGASAVTVREYAPSETETEGVPRWFLARDANGDGQLSLREFSPTLSLDSTAFFGRLDADNDGLVTPDEVKNFLAKGGNSTGTEKN